MEVIVIDPLVLKSAGVFLLFGTLLILFMHLFRKKFKIPIDIGIIPSAVLTFLVMLLFIYRMDIQKWGGEATSIISQFGEHPIRIMLVAILIPIAGGSVAYLIVNRFSQQTYRSFIHMLIGILFLFFLSVNIILTIIAACIAMDVFCLLEYFRESGDKGKLARLATTLISRALRGGEVAGLIASFLFLVGIFLVAVFLYPIRPEYALGPVVLLTFADPTAALVGKKFGKHKWTINPEKSLEGSLGMFLVGFLVLIILGFVPGYKIGIAMAIVVALCVTIVESLPLRIGDNIIIPLVAGMVMISGVASSLVGLDLQFWTYAIAISFIAGVAFHLTRILEPRGIAIAIFFGILICSSSSFGRTLLVALVIFFALGSLLTKFEHACKGEVISLKRATGRLDSVKMYFVHHWKRIVHTARSKNGMWELNPMIANGIIPVFAAILYDFNPTISLSLFMGSLAAGLADTAARAIGIVDEKQIMLLDWKRVKPGTRGAISLTGEIAAIFGSLAIGGIGLALLPLAPAVPLGIGGTKLLGIALVGGIVGSNVDSLLGCSIQFLSREEVNLFGTLSGAAVALLMII